MEARHFGQFDADHLHRPTDRQTEKLLGEVLRLLGVVETSYTEAQTDSWVRRGFTDSPSPWKLCKAGVLFGMYGALFDLGVLSRMAMVLGRMRSLVVWEGAPLAPDVTGKNRINT